MCIFFSDFLELIIIDHYLGTLTNADLMLFHFKLPVHFSPFNMLCIFQMKKKVICRIIEIL
jgi:hypothetical protein